MKLKSIKAWLLRIAGVVRRLLEREYTYEMMVQKDDNCNPVICGEFVKWLGDITVRAMTYNKSIDKALEKANALYPEYNGLVQIF